MRPSWPCVHVWALQRVSEHGYEWENVAYVCSAPQLFAAIFIWGGQALTRHTNTHLRLSGLRRGLQRPGPVILTRTHIWTLLPALHYSAAHAINTLNCDYTGNYEKHFNRSAGNAKHRTSLKWNIKVFMLLRRRATSSLIMEEDSKAHILVSALSYWERFWPRSTTDGRV